MKDSISLALCVALGGTLVWAGLQKLRSPGDFIAGVGRYEVLPRRLVAPVAIGVLAFETVAGTLLVANLASLFAMATAMALFAMFSGAIAFSLLRRNDAPCFCFGADETEAISIATLVRALLLFALSVIGTLILSSGGTGIPRPSELVAALTLAAAIVVASRLIAAFPAAMRAFRTRPVISPTGTPRISFRSEPLEFSLKRAVAYRQGAGGSWPGVTGGESD